DGDEFVLWKDQQHLAADAARSPSMARTLAVWREPPLIAVLPVGVQFHMRSHRFRNPLRREQPLPIPDAVVQIEIADLRQVPGAQVQAALGVDDAERGALPVVVLNAERREQVA